MAFRAATLAAMLGAAAPAAAGDRRASGRGRRLRDKSHDLGFDRGRRVGGSPDLGIGPDKVPAKAFGANEWRHCLVAVMQPPRSRQRAAGR